MLGSYGYYTGILFRAYTFGTGDAVVKGGRYDQLMGYFGKPAASIGFVVQADELLNALSRQKIAIPVRRRTDAGSSMTVSSVIRRSKHPFRSAGTEERQL